VIDPTVFPFNTLGLIIANSKDGKTKSGCTGALIAANYVLTAAHCLHDPSSGYDIASAIFSPGYSTDLPVSAPFGSVPMVEWKIPVAFENCGTGAYTLCHQTYDFGIMKIDASYNLWMDFSYDSLDAGSEIVNTAGYPGQLPLLCL
jgi:V8-like Glu-specific endopeptidase